MNAPVSSAPHAMTELKRIVLAEDNANEQTGAHARGAY